MMTPAEIREVERMAAKANEPGAEVTDAVALSYKVPALLEHIRELEADRDKWHREALHQLRLQRDRQGRASA
jgi:hypothetical protein